MALKDISRSLGGACSYQRHPLPLCLPRGDRRSCIARAQLSSKRCLPCEPDSQALQYMGLCGALSKGEEEQLLLELEGWQVAEVSGYDRLEKNFRCKNFKKALELCSRVAGIAEAEGHHPDMHLTGWNQLQLSLWTHARQGLTENDFIMAAKVDEMPKDDLLSSRQREQNT